MNSHGTADVFSLGLWEVFSTPTEAYFSRSNMKLEMAYDSKDLVKASRPVGNDPAVPEATTPQQKPDVPTENQPPGLGS